MARSESILSPDTRAAASPFADECLVEPITSRRFDQAEYDLTEFRDCAESREQPFLVDVLSGRQKLQLRALIIVWASWLIFFYLWWFREEHIAGPFRFLLNTVLLTWTLGMPAYYLFFVSRMKRPNPNLRLPDHWRVAMVTTRAPSEPFAVVKQTLQAMLSQSYRHDTWLADEDPTEEIYRWCAEHGVKISTRKGVAAYHRCSWPRRARCKEGNLAYFYDQYGYEHYQFVVQLDADHEPTEGYLEAMLRPFADPAVGYVSAPSICSKNSQSSWSARGRLYSESLMQGPMQAGYSNGFAPLCIGSHYAVRTAALRQIGGLGPELAEDHSTTLMMAAHGWRGTHALDAIAIGEGPPTLAACITQEFQWSRSLMVLLLTLLPKCWHALSWRLRFQFLFCELWFPIFGSTMLLGLALPILAVVSKRPWVEVSYIDFLLHTTPVLCATAATLFYLRRQGILRPSVCPVVSWEMGLFQVIRWPWVVYGSLIGVLIAIRKQNVEFRVTPKGASTSTSMRWLLLLPYIVIVVLSFLPAVFIHDAGAAQGYFFFLILAQIVYVVALFSVVLIHRHETSQNL